MSALKGLKDWDGLDDTILLLSDDNFANVRTLPTKENRDRKAGWGLYYHFDYHGAPVSYEWVNSTTLPKVWEQLTMAYEYGIRDLWVVNVGDIRPQELPLSYYMELAYDYEGMGIDHANETDLFVKKWVEQQFGGLVEDEDVKNDIVSVLKAYTRMHGNRRPEVTYPNTYHVTNYDENDRMIELCHQIKAIADSVDEKIPEEAKASYYGLVYYPAVAGANVQLMNLYAAKNQFYSENAVAAAKLYKEKVDACIAYDEELTKYYNEGMADGKWNGMMLSAHIGFTRWNDEDWKYPETVEFEPAKEDGLLVFAANNDKFIREGVTYLPEFTSVGNESYGIWVANTAEKTLDTTITTDHEAVVVEEIDSVAESMNQYIVSVDWSKVSNDFEGTITIQAAESEVKVKVSAIVVDEKSLTPMTFVERDSIVSMEAEHYAESVEKDGFSWKNLKEYGKTLSSMKIYPMDQNFDTLGEAPALIYRVLIREGGEYTLRVITAPTNNLEDGRNMRYAVCADNGEVTAVKTILDENYNIGGGASRAHDWGEGVLNNCHYGESQLTLTPGVHDITIYGVEAGLVLQKLVLYKGDLPGSYFGPTENGFTK